MINRESIIALDGLRGWMAVWVWVTHVVTMATLPLVKSSGAGIVLANGQYAVGVFILISGFVISNTAIKHNWRTFITRRFFRLFPVYIVCLLVSILVLDLSLYVLNNTPWPMERLVDRVKYLTDSKDNFWIHLPLHLLLMHGLVPDKLLSSTSYAFMGQAWSLTLEWQYYLISILFLKLISYTKKNIILECIAIFVLVILASKLSQPSFIASNLWLFLVGHLFWKNFDEKEAWRYPLWMLAAIPAGPKVFSILIFSLVIYACLRGWGIKSIFENTLSKFLGRISYGFYCVHMISIFTLAYFLMFVIHVESRLVYGFSLIIGSLLISVFLSWLLNIYIEKPMIEYARRLKYPVKK